MNTRKSFSGLLAGSVYTYVYFGFWLIRTKQLCSSRHSYSKAKTRCLQQCARDAKPFTLEPANTAPWRSKKPQLAADSLFCRYDSDLRSSHKTSSQNVSTTKQAAQAMEAACIPQTGSSMQQWVCAVCDKGLFGWGGGRGGGLRAYGFSTCAAVQL